MRDCAWRQTTKITQWSKTWSIHSVSSTQPHSTSSASHSIPLAPDLAGRLQAGPKQEDRARTASGESVSLSIATWCLALFLWPHPSSACCFLDFIALCAVLLALSSCSAAFSSAYYPRNSIQLCLFTTSFPLLPPFSVPTSFAYRRNMSHRQTQAHPFTA